MYYLWEILGVIAIIASLVYVGRRFSFLGNRELAECWAKGSSDFDSLDDVDKQRLICLEGAAINSWHQLFHLRQHGLLSDERWNYQLWVVRHIGQRQAMREAWKQFEDAYDEPFREFMDEHLK